MRAWEAARIMGHRAFYEGATKHLHDKIQETLDTWQGGSTAAALATEIGKLFI